MVRSFAKLRLAGGPPALLLIAVLFLAPLLATAEVGQGDTPELTLKTLDGEDLDLTELRGRVVLLDFWATWCPPCRQSFPVYAELAQKFGEQGLTVVAVSVDEKPKKVRRHIEKNPVPFVIALDENHAAAKQFEPEGMPTAYLIDRKGVVRVVHNGFEPKDRELLEQEIVKLLQEEH